MDRAALSCPLGLIVWGLQVKNNCDFLLIFIRMVCEDYPGMNMFFQQKVSFFLFNFLDHCYIAVRLK